MLFLQQYGISLTLAVKIYNTYGEEIYSILQKNPYRLADDIDGVGFRIADEIASKVGIRTDSDFRIRSGMIYCLQREKGTRICRRSCSSRARQSFWKFPGRASRKT